MDIVAEVRRPEPSELAAGIGPATPDSTATAISLLYAPATVARPNGRRVDLRRNGLRHPRSPDPPGAGRAVARGYPAGVHRPGVNVAPYKQGVSYRGGWTHIDGWSERGIDYVREAEAGPLPRFLNPEEEPDLLRVSRRAVYNRLRSGQLPAIRTGNVWRIRCEDIGPQPAQGG